MNLLDLKLRNKLYILIICLYISFYFAFYSTHLNEFIAAIERSGHPALNLLQVTVFNFISLIWQFIIAFIISFIVSYYIQNLPSIIYIMIPFILKGISFFGMICITYGITEVIHDFNKLTMSDVLSDIWSTIFLSLILIAMAFGGYAGYKINLKHDYLDQSDSEKYYFYGIPKKQWVAILLVMTPVLQFINRLTNIIIYGITNNITSANFWSNFWINFFGFELTSNFGSSYGITGIIIRIVFMFLVWGIWIQCLIYGVQTIKEKERPYRKIIIGLIFIVLPLLILVIPIIRNRDWFY